MKKLTLSLLFYILLVAFCVLVTSCSGHQISATTGLPLEIAHYVILGLLAIYEIIVRVIPTVQNYSIVAFVIKILKWLSDATNRSA
jgi:hypothetical protein